jgi:adenylate cyclase
MSKLSRLAQSFGLGRVVCLFLLAALVMLRIWDPPPLASLRARTFDFYQVLKPRDAKLQPVVIVDIDEASLAAYGQWPWPRTLLADLVDKLSNLGAAAIGFDIIFAEPDRMSPAVAAQNFRNLDEQTRAQLEKLPSNDEVFADAIRRSGRVVLGQSGHHLALPKAAAQRPKVGFAMIGPNPSPYLMTFPGLIRNIPVLEKSAAGLGMLSVRAEPDGIVRRAPMVMKAEGHIVPSLSLEMLRVVTHSGAIRIKTDAAGIQNIAIPGLIMPTDRDGQLWVHFAHYNPKRYVSAKDVLQDHVPADRVNRKLVLIGTSAVGLRDIKTTPIEPAMSGVEVHAQLLENVLSNSVLTYPNYAIGVELVTTVIFGLAIIALAPVLGATMMLALGAIVGAVLAAGSWYFFTEQRLLIDATYPLLATFLIYLTLIFINYFREQFQRRRIRTAFGQYLAPSLVEQLAQSHETLVLGGEERDMTILFSDIRGFTTISEIYKHDPQGLTSLINHFLTPMTSAIIDHNGTIDKYIGDAIMAFWNAPLRDARHELDACEAALEMLQRVETLNAQRKEEADAAGHRFIPIKIGVGINTGRCVVGNMGSDLRFNYSVLGDPVNLASRLEGQTKSYGVSIIVGSSTARLARDKFAVLELDCITVKGKTEPENIYTLLGREDVAGSDRFKHVQTVFNDVLARYRGRDFAGAEQALLRCREASAEFGLGHLGDLYASRCAAFRKDPPPADWNGVFALDTK